MPSSFTAQVKDGSHDMLFERIEASGLGLTIGSIGGSSNNNITFRDCHMHKTSKGIYMKFRGNGGVVSNVRTLDRASERDLSRIHFLRLHSRSS